MRLADGVTIKLSTCVKLKRIHCKHNTYTLRYYYWQSHQKQVLHFNHSPHSKLNIISLL